MRAFTGLPRLAHWTAGACQRHFCSSLRIVLDSWLVGLMAQWKSVPFTPERSLVRSQLRPQIARAPRSVRAFAYPGPAAGGYWLLGGWPEPGSRRKYSGGEVAWIAGNFLTYFDD